MATSNINLRSAVFLDRCYATKLKTNFPSGAEIPCNPGTTDFSKNIAVNKKNLANCLIDYSIGKDGIPGSTLSFCAGSVQSLVDVTGTFRERLEYYADIFHIDPHIIFGILTMESGGSLVEVLSSSNMLNSKDPFYFTRVMVDRAAYLKPIIRAEKQDDGTVVKKIAELQGTILNPALCTGLCQIQVAKPGSKYASVTALNESIACALGKNLDMYYTPYERSLSSYAKLKNEITNIRERLDNFIRRLWEPAGHVIIHPIIISDVKTHIPQLKDANAETITSTVVSAIKATYGSDFLAVAEPTSDPNEYRIAIPKYKILGKKYSFRGDKLKLNESAEIKAMLYAIALMFDTDATILISYSLLRIKMYEWGIRGASRISQYLKDHKGKNILDAGMHLWPGAGGIRSNKPLLESVAKCQFASQEQQNSGKFYNADAIKVGIGGYLGYGSKDQITNITPDAYITKASQYFIRYEAKFLNKNDPSYVFPDLTTNTWIVNKNAKFIIDGGDAFLETKTETVMDSDTQIYDIKADPIEIENMLVQARSEFLDEIGVMVNLKNLKDDEIKKLEKEMYRNDFYGNQRILDLSGIIGLPPRFPDLVDPRLSKSERTTFGLSDIEDDIYGPLYSKLYLGRAHIVTLTPGDPEFLPGFNDTDREVAIDATKQAQSGEGGGSNYAADNNLSELRNKTREQRAGGTLFGFTHNYVKYTNMVKALNYATAVMMGITDHDWWGILDDNERKAIFKGVEPPKDGSLSYKYFDPMLLDMNPNQTYNIYESTASDEELIKKDFKGMGVYNTYVYNDGPMEMSESVDNTIGPSILNNLLGMTPNDAAKDLNFLTGGLNGNFLSGGADFVKERIGKSSLFKKAFAEGGIFSTALGKTIGISSVAAASIAGANIKLPEVFKDSNYSKSFTLKVKLSSPNNDRMSFFKYILTEFNRLAPYALPQQYGAFVDAQVAPFVTQIYTKGLCACELAMCSEMTIVRSPENMSLNKYPTELDITMVFKDLSPVLSIPMDPSNINGQYDRKLINSGIVPYISTYLGIPLYRNDNLTFFKRKTAKLRHMANLIVSTPSKYVVMWGQNKIRKIVDNLIR